MNLAGLSARRLCTGCVVDGPCCIESGSGHCRVGRYRRGLVE